MSQRYLISNLLFSFTSQSGIHVFQSIWSKPSRLNFIPFLSVFFVCRSQRQSRRKMFFSSEHIHPPGTNISAKSNEAAHCGRFGTWELKNTKNQRWRAEGNAGGIVGYSLVFHLFYKVSSDFRWIRH